MKKCNLIYCVCAVMMLVLTACGSSKSSTSSATDENRSGDAEITASTGGTVKFNNELVLSVPPGSLSEDVDIKIERNDSISMTFEDGYQLAGQAYSCTPDGTEFALNNPAVMEMYYDEAAITAKGLDPRTLSIFYYDEQNSKYVAVESSVDLESKKIIAHIEHFTVYLPLAKALVATNNPPTIAVQSPVPGTIRTGAPIYLRATIREHDVNGSLVSPKAYYRKRNPSVDAWQNLPMKREPKQTGSSREFDTFVATVPAAYLDDTCMGSGNDFEYYIEAYDNLSALTRSAIRGYNVTRTLNKSKIAISPASRTVTAGFESLFVVKGIDNSGSGFQFIPDSYSVSNSLGTVKNFGTRGVNFLAQKKGSGYLTVTAGSASKTAALTVKTGQVTKMKILDTNGLDFAGELIITGGGTYSFDVIGYDEFENTSVVSPVWSCDASLGTIDQNGKFTTTTTESLNGNVYVRIGDVTASQQVVVKFPPKDMLTFSIGTSTGTIHAPYINVSVSEALDVSDIAPVFTTNGTKVLVGGMEQESGVTKQDFSDPLQPVVYTVFSEDGSSRDYTVTITRQSSAKMITSFSINGINGEISGSNIIVNIPEGTDISSLSPVITFTGVSVNPASGSAVNFTDPVTYMVTAEDGSTKSYVVSVDSLAFSLSEKIPSRCGYGWSSISSSADGSKLSACRSRGYIYTSDDGGMNWVERVSAGSSRNWYEITSSADGTKLAAVEYSGYICTSNDGGITWTKRISSSGNVWGAITSSSDGTKLAAAIFYGYIYTSGNGGITWTARTSAGSRAWGGIASSTNGTRLAAIVSPNQYDPNEDEYIYTSSDGGITWAERRGAGHRWWRDIASSADGTRLAAVASKYNANSNGYVYTSRDGGVTWTERTGAGSRHWWSITSSADGLKLAVADSDGNIYSSIDGGITWTKRTIPSSNPYMNITLSSDGTKLAACSYYEHIAISADNGATWMINKNVRELDMRSVAISPDGRYIAIADYDGSIYYSSDSGVTFAPDSFWIGTNNKWSSVSIGSYGSSSIVAAEEYGCVYSLDSRSEMNKLVYTPQYWRSVVVSADGQKVAAVADGGYIYTGTTYGLSERTNSGKRSWRSISLSSNGTKLAAAANGDYIYTSSDSGVTWTAQSGAGNRLWSSIAITSDGTKLAASVSNGYIYTSADGGVTWTERTGAGARDWTSIAVSVDAAKIAVVSKTGYLYVSTDGGATWEKSYKSLYPQWASVCVSPDFSKIFAVGYGFHGIFGKP